MSGNQPDSSTQSEFPKNVLPMGQCSYLSAVLELKLSNQIPNMTSLEFIKDSLFYSQILPNTLNQLEDLVNNKLIIAWIQFTYSKINM